MNIDAIFLLLAPSDLYNYFLVGDPILVSIFFYLIYYCSVDYYIIHSYKSISLLWLLFVISDLSKFTDFSRLVIWSFEIDDLLLLSVSDSLVMTFSSSFIGYKFLLDEND